MALFTTTAYPLIALIEDISLGKIGLPDIQRPFVWPNVNVRNLFDSLYRGYPAGYLLFWETGADPDMRRIGEQPDDKIQLSALKTIAGFLNAQGGTLMIGVDDDGKVLGLVPDGFPNEDKMGLHLVNLIRDRIGDIFLPYVHPRFEDEYDERVLVIRCEKGPKSAFVRDGSVQRFYVRGANATVELSGTSLMDYVKGHYN